MDSQYVDGRGKPLPNPVPPGYAIISDGTGQGLQVVELHNLLAPMKKTTVMPVDGRARGRMVVGSLIGQLKDGSLVCHQYTDYPETPAGTDPHLIGQAAYPEHQKPKTFVPVNGTHYNVQTSIGAGMRAEVAPKKPTGRDEK